MIAELQKKGLRFFHPILRRIAGLYLSRERSYSHSNVKVRVLPGVFHPGLFFSTKILLEHVKNLDIKDLRVLELGAGSGLLSIYCAKNGAYVTASDINPVAIKGLEQNVSDNKVRVEIRQSDLFENLSPDDYDLILINPPYYPKDPKTMEQRAWFCGSNLEFFQKIFLQLKHFDGRTLMVLSEQCNIPKISKIARSHELGWTEVYSSRALGELSIVYEICRSERPNLS